MSKCYLDFCENNSHAQKLCVGHYSQLRKGKEFSPLIVKGNAASKYPCTFSGCVNKQQAKGLCGAHWRQQHIGKPLRKLRNQEPILERIFKQVNKTEDCWFWTGRIAGQRKYGQISLLGKQTMVHRIVFEEMVRKLEPGETIDHVCRNKLCVNPEHLEALSLRDNVKRMHSYRGLLKEIDRLVYFIEFLGYDSKTLQKRKVGDDADVSTI